MSMEGRLTICNMSIEAGARIGMIAPDDTTYEFLDGRRHAPQGADWDKALAYWATLPTDAGAQFDRELSFDAAQLAPMVSWGTSPEDCAPVNGVVPDPARHRRRRPPPARRARARLYEAQAGDAAAGDHDRPRFHRLLHQQPHRGPARGGCCSQRPPRPRARHGVAGLDRREAAGGSRRARSRSSSPPGFEWRDPSCSMCGGSNGELIAPGERCASTTNRNFEGRQGRGALTHIMSPAMVAAAAVFGRLADVRRMTR